MRPRVALDTVQRRETVRRAVERGDDPAAGHVERRRAGRHRRVGPVLHPDFDDGENRLLVALALGVFALGVFVPRLARDEEAPTVRPVHEQRAVVGRSGDRHR
ncbi:hypothetical protein [Halorussus salinus]|uniref:hypothetical protein n=1 Tax=Halorussus salinus TaxID=1364935 RepID=UPI001092E25B|nr:hypothetical protein [Halorussus salinus]